MGKIAFVFPGQGSQTAGMGYDLYENIPVSRKIFERLEMVRPGTLEACFTGKNLDRTDNAQPCIYSVGIAAAAAVKELGVYPDMLAGFSVGELTAAGFADMFTFEEGLALVAERGAAMCKAAEEADTGMAAVLKLPKNVVTALCKGYSGVYPVNFNSPEQIAVAGLKSELEDFCRDVREAGGRAVPLKVQGAFHSPFMTDAAKEFERVLQKYTLCKPRLPLYSNVTGEVYGSDYASLLTEQITSPVRWQKIIKNMEAAGVGIFIESAPGKTLSGLIKRTLPAAKVFSASDTDGLRSIMEEIKC